MTAMTSPSARPRSAKPSAGLRRNRDWRRLWLGQAISLTGDSVFEITIVLWVSVVIAKGQTWAPAAGSGVLIAAAVPVLVIGPVAGVYVDRWNRRHVMMAADAFRAVLIASMLALPSIAPVTGRETEIAAIYLAVALESAAAQFFNPARLATLGQIVPPADQAKASGLLQATGNLALVIGPPLAAPLLFVVGPRWALAIDAASFAGSFAAIWTIVLPGSSRERSRDTGFRREFRAGVRFFAANRVLIALCAGIAIATLGTGAVNALEVFFVTGDLHTAAKWLGVLAGATGAGAVVGALLGGWTAGRVGAARVFSVSLIGCGVLLAAFSQTTSFPWAVLFIALTGMMAGALNAAAPPLFLGAIPPQLIGRIMAIFNPLQQLAAITSMALAGFLASTVLRALHVHVAGLTFGPINTIFACGALLITAAGCAVLAPLSRRHEVGDAIPTPLSLTIEPPHHRQHPSPGADRVERHSTGSRSRHPSPFPPNGTFGWQRVRPKVPLGGNADVPRGHTRRSHEDQNRTIRPHSGCCPGRRHQLPGSGGEPADRELPLSPSHGSSPQRSFKWAP
jgi:MFS family permease